MTIHRMKIALVGLAVLSGCSIMDAAPAVLKAATGLTDSSGVQVSAQVGKEANKQIILGNQVKKEVGKVEGVLNNTEVETSTAFSGNLQTENYVVNNSTETQAYLYIFLAFMLGVCFPSHRELIAWYKDIKVQVNDST